MLGCTIYRLHVTLIFLATTHFVWSCSDQLMERRTSFRTSHDRVGLNCKEHYQQVCTYIRLD